MEVERPMNSFILEEKEKEKEIKKNELKVLSRLMNYSHIINVMNKTKEYYNTMKDSNYLMRIGCETMEYNIEKGIQWIKPKIEPIIQNEIYKKYSEPILIKVDNFGCNQLDKLEKLNESSKKILQNTISYIYDLKSTSKNITTALQEKINPIDNYLKESFIGLPLNITVDVTEKIYNKISKETKKEKITETTKGGPILRATQLSSKIQKETVEKLKNLSLKNLENQKIIQQCLEITHSLISNLELGIKITNEILNEKLKKGQETFHQKQKDLLEKMNNIKIDILNILELLVLQLPSIPLEMISKKMKSLKLTKIQLETEKEFHQFIEFSNNSIKKLKDVTITLSSFISQNYLPTNAISSIINLIYSIVQNFFIINSKQEQEKIESLTNDDDDENDKK